MIEPEDSPKRYYIQYRCNVCQNWAFWGTHAELTNGICKTCADKLNEKVQFHAIKLPFDLLDQEQPCCRKCGATDLNTNKNALCEECSLQTAYAKRANAGKQKK